MQGELFPLERQTSLFEQACVCGHNFYHHGGLGNHCDLADLPPWKIDHCDCTGYVVANVR